MAVAVIIPDRDISLFLEELSGMIEDDIITDIDSIDKNQVEIAILWKQPPGTISSFPNLKLICSYGAGVEHIIEDTDFDPSIPVTRIIDEDLTLSMTRYVVAAISMFQYGLHFNADEILRGKALIKPFYSPDLTIGILGLGALGQASAKYCRTLGYEVIGLSRKKKEIEDIRTFALSEMNDFLSQTNILVCMLPLTDQTKDMINYDLLSKLKTPAFFINIGRGDQVVEEDLLKAVEDQIIMGACLDVVKNEPITENHPFISESRIIITPHIASITDHKSAARIIGDNINRFKRGENLNYLVDPVSGY